MNVKHSVLSTAKSTLMCANVWERGQRPRQHKGESFRSGKLLTALGSSILEVLLTHKSPISTVVNLTQIFERFQQSIYSHSALETVEATAVVVTSACTVDLVLLDEVLEIAAVIPEGEGGGRPGQE